MDAWFSSQKESIVACIAPMAFASVSILLALALSTVFAIESKLVFLNGLPSPHSLEDFCDIAEEVTAHLTRFIPSLSGYEVHDIKINPKFCRSCCYSVSMLDSAV